MSSYGHMLKDLPPQQPHGLHILVKTKYLLFSNTVLSRVLIVDGLASSSGTLTKGECDQEMPKITYYRPTHGTVRKSQITIKATLHSVKK